MLQKTSQGMLVAQETDGKNNLYTPSSHEFCTTKYQSLLKQFEELAQKKVTMKSHKDPHASA
jgi:hypothetical protein